MARAGNCAAACCTNPLVPQLPPAGSCDRSRRAAMVHPPCGGVWMVAQHPLSADRQPGPRTPGPGPHQLQGHAAASRLGHGRASLRDLKKPIGVAGWETKIVEKLPEDLKGSLPTVQELEAELS